MSQSRTIRIVISLATSLLFFACAGRTPSSSTMVSDLCAPASTRPGPGPSPAAPGGFVTEIGMAPVDTAMTAPGPGPSPTVPGTR